MNNEQKNKIVPLHILTTGGTIEKIYDETDGSLQNRETIIRNKILQRLRLPYAEIRVRSIMSKDSLVMDDEDREKICEAIRYVAIDGHPIVVLHGTDTMDLTVRYCCEHFPKPQVPVVFTGAMKPMGFDDSDATQNVVEAIFAARLMKAGYYVTFHGQLYEAAAFKKNKDKGTFEAL